MEPVLIIGIIFSLPILGVLSSTYLKALKLKAQANTSQGLTNEDKKLLYNALHKNEDLQKRIENLEIIITSMDKEILALQGQTLLEESKQKTEELAQKMKKKPDEQ
ncbi:MAG: hypothetical protein EAZ55_09680 [Cytophagales bacterium]|nr:MAG: hypothetical protein EAZ55_09680 [Cytophagales bacterium]